MWVLGCMQGVLGPHVLAAPIIFVFNSSKSSDLPKFLIEGSDKAERFKSAPGCVAIHFQSSMRASGRESDILHKRSR